VGTMVWNEACCFTCGHPSSQGPCECRRKTPTRNARDDHVPQPLVLHDGIFQTVGGRKILVTNGRATVLPRAATRNAGEFVPQPMVLATVLNSKRKVGEDEEHSKDESELPEFERTLERSKRYHAAKRSKGGPTVNRPPVYTGAGATGLVNNHDDDFVPTPLPRVRTDWKKERELLDARQRGDRD
jgi:hypothetical protein